MTPEEREDKISKLGPEQRKLYEELKTKIENGESITSELDLHECRDKLICNNCSSKNIVWLLEQNNNEVIFNCKNCKNKGVITKEQYMFAVRDNPNKVFT